MFKILKQIHNASQTKIEEVNPETDVEVNEDMELNEIEK